MTPKTRKKVLYIVTKSVWAGAGKYVFDLATGLPHGKFEASVAAGGKDMLAQKIIEGGIPYYEIKNFRRDVNIFRDLASLVEITKLLFSSKPDIVHVSSAKAGGIAGLASLFYKLFSEEKIRTIFTVHGWTFSERRPGWQIVLIKLFSKITCLFYDQIICVSEHDRKIAIGNNIAPADKLIAIHNGIKTDYYDFYSRDEARKKLGLHEKDFVVGTIGEFTKNKGHRYLIEAAENLKNIKFVIIGFGEEENNLREKIKKIGAEKRFFIETDKPDAAFYLKAFDVFVLPSLKEGLPYVLLEAALAECPIISTNVGGIQEIIINQETGLLVEPMAPYELEGDIESLYKNREHGANLAKNAKEKVTKEFSFKTMLEKTISLY